MEWNNSENKTTSLEMALEDEKNIMKNLVLPELSKFSNGERLFSEYEMELLADKETLTFSEVLGLNSEFLKELYNLNEGINSWWKNGARNDLLEMTKYKLEKDTVLSKHFEDYIEYLYLNNEYEVSFRNNNWFNETCEKFKELHYAERLVEEFKDIVPDSKDIAEFVEQGKLMEPDFDFSKTVDLYIKATKYYQAAELVSTWDKQMVNDYADFVIEKINSKDPKFEKYYEQMHEIEKKNAIPDRYKEILSKVDEEYDKQKEKNELEHVGTRTER